MEHNWKFLNHEHVYKTECCSNCGLRSFIVVETGKRWYYLIPGIDIDVNKDDSPKPKCTEWIIKNIIE